MTSLLTAPPLRFLVANLGSGRDKVLIRFEAIACPSFLPPAAMASREREREMRLLTHNMLSSNIKGVTNGFPLLIEPTKVVEKQVDFNPDFLKNMFVKVDWKALVGASSALGYAELPEEADAGALESEDFLRRFHRALLELHVEEGTLVCPETGRRFPVNKGIPNMLLHEDEV